MVEELNREIDRPRVAAALAIVAEKLSAGLIHKDSSAAMVALYDSGLAWSEDPAACPPGAELFYAPSSADGVVERSGDILVGYRSNDSDGDGFDVSLRVGGELLDPVHVPPRSIRDGFAYALDDMAILPLIAIVFHEVSTEYPTRQRFLLVMAHLDMSTRRNFAVHGGRHRDRNGRCIKIINGMLDIVSDADDQDVFDNIRNYHDLVCR